ncbi:MAG: M16 family metallopeptidase [Candidatus Roizmanbacteria bacterium]
MKTSLHTLENGLKLLLVDTASFPSLTSLVLVGAGSRYEDEMTNGIAHFFEHMAFKGSKNYPNSFAISSTIDGFGGINNAFTSKDYTGYWIKAPSVHVEKCVDVLADMIQNPLLKEDDIKTERGVIIEEINMYEDMPSRDIYDVFETVMYQNSRLAMPIIGTKETVSSFTSETFRDYINTFYHPNNAVMILAGGLYVDGKKESDYINLVKEKFGSWKNLDVSPPEKYISDQKTPRIFVKSKKTEQAHFALGFKTFSFKDERKYALSILSTILGGGMSSRLFMEVREKKGLCYYIHSYSDFYEDTGALVTNAGVSLSPEQVRQAISLTLDEHTKMKKGEITTEEIVRAKEILKGNMVLGLEDSQRVANFFGKALLQENELKNPEEIIKEIEKVTIEDLTSVAKEYFVPGNLTIAMIGPLEEKVLKEFENWK